VKNEDIYLSRAINNIIEFSDDIIIADNNSSDQTGSIAKHLSAINAKVQYHCIDDPSVSHDLILPYVGTDTWIFAVDGDEIYDPFGLVKLREEIRNGNYKDYLMVYGNVLHCTELDLINKNAMGYLARPSRSMTKLYNFSQIKEWSSDCSERLHGGEAVYFNPDIVNKRFRFDYDYTWENSSFRCLHAVFLQRSSLDKKKHVGRLNIHDKLMMGRKRKLYNYVLKILGMNTVSSTKNEYYRRGDLVTKNVGTFFNDAVS
tara:strand:- start:30 stop:806 length:777 start_codon:yes stop_codon:yes gene_type:complete